MRKNNHVFIHCVKNNLQNVKIKGFNLAECSALLLWIDIEIGTL